MTCAMGTTGMFFGPLFSLALISLLHRVILGPGRRGWVTRRGGALLWGTGGVALPPGALRARYGSELLIRQVKRSIYNYQVGNVPIVSKQIGPTLKRVYFLSLRIITISQLSDGFAS